MIANRQAFYLNHALNLRTRIRFITQNSNSCVQDAQLRIAPFGSAVRLSASRQNSLAITPVFNRASAKSHSRAPRWRKPKLVALEGTFQQTMTPDSTMLYLLQ